MHYHVNLTIISLLFSVGAENNERSKVCVCYLSFQEEHVMRGGSEEPLKCKISAEVSQEPLKCKISAEVSQVIE